MNKKVLVSMAIGSVIGHTLTKQKDKSKQPRKGRSLGKFLSDAITRGIAEEITEMVYGEKPHRYNRWDMAGHSYQSYYHRRPTTYTPYKTHIDSVVFKMREDAESILSQLNSIMDSYGTVKLSDYLDLAGLSHSFKDNELGWIGDDLKAAAIIRNYGRYTITLPETRELD